MSKKSKTRETLLGILASCSETLFPENCDGVPIALNTHGIEGDTPLHVMLWRDDTYAVLQLIKAGADVNALGDMSETPLHVAVRKQNIPAIEAILDIGADLSCISDFGQSPRDIANEVGGDVLRLFTNG